MPIIRIRARSAPCESGWTRPGTLAGADATQMPSAISATPKTRTSRSPWGASFSTKITAATTAIQNRLITPSANRASISPRQHPMQNAPCSSPIRKAPARPWRQSWSRKWSGDRQWRRQTSLSGVS